MSNDAFLIVGLFFAALAVGGIIWLARRLDSRRVKRIGLIGRLAGKNTDENLREALLEKIRLLGLPGSSRVPVVSLEDFFTGNYDVGSIGCNLNDAHPQAFYKVLKAIRQRPEVQGVWVGIVDVEVALFNPDIWPFSDHVYILTSAPVEDVSEWVAPLEVDEVGEAHDQMFLEVDDVGEVHVGTLQPIGLPDPLPGYKALFAWWD